MAIKVEPKAVNEVRAGNGEAYQEFLIALRTIKMGHSFVVPELRAAHRVVLGACPSLLGKKFRTRKEAEGGYRVGRVK